MDKKVNTPFGKMSKKADLILGVLIFISAIGYGIAKFKFSESEKMIDTIFLLGWGISFGVFCCVYSFLYAPTQEPNSEDDFDATLADYFQEIDAEKENYRGSWDAVEEWKQKMREKVEEVKQRFLKEGETEAVMEDWEILDDELQNGLDVVQEGKNPLVINGGNKQNPVSNHELELSTFGKRVIPLLILIPMIFLYLVLSTLECSIFLLTIAFAYFFFPNGIPLTLSDTPSPWNGYHLKFISFNLKHLIGIIIMSVFGYYLNKWTYAQSGEVQLTITVVLPIIYGLTYYRIKNKKSVREI